MAPKLHAVIFSKDRALQLELLLRSLADHLGGVELSATVLHRASDAGFAEGYRRLAGRPPLGGVRWVEERAFRDDFLALLGGMVPDAPVMLLVDDDVLHRPVDMAPLLGAFSRRHLFVSLRADRSYPTPTMPRLRDAGTHLEWRWHDFGRQGVWQYPFSVDGNVFQAGVIGRLARSLDFRAPNSLEGEMDKGRHHPRFSLLRPLAIAPKAAVLFNAPLNRAQTEGETWHAGTDLAELNRAFLDGRSIDPAPFYAATPRDTHHAVPVTLVPGRRSLTGPAPGQPESTP